MLQQRSRRQKTEDFQSEEVQALTLTKKRTLKQSGIAESEDKQDQVADNNKRRKVDEQVQASGGLLDEPEVKTKEPDTQAEKEPLKAAEASKKSQNDNELLSDLSEDAIMDAVEENNDCLKGMTIVVTGIFDKTTREHVIGLITKYGARNTGSVSGKTDYLIAGYKLEDGRDVEMGGKYKAAQTKGIPILSEDKFQEFMKKMTRDSKFCIQPEGPAIPEESTLVVPAPVETHHAISSE